MYRHLRTLAAAALAAALAGIPALAGPALDAAKAECQIGETIEGYLDVVPFAAPSAQALAEMEEVNNGRRAVYMESSRSNSVDLNVVAQLTGEKQVEKARDAGECYRDAGGWKMRE